MSTTRSNPASSRSRNRRIASASVVSTSLASSIDMILPSRFTAAF
jgi:hypothetical protein